MVLFASCTALPYLGSESVSPGWVRRVLLSRIATQRQLSHYPTVLGAPQAGELKIRLTEIPWELPQCQPILSSPEGRWQWEQRWRCPSSPWRPGAAAAQCRSVPTAWAGGGGRDESPPREDWVLLARGTHPTPDPISTHSELRLKWNFFSILLRKYFFFLKAQQEFILVRRFCGSTHTAPR